MLIVILFFKGQRRNVNERQGVTIKCQDESKVIIAVMPSKYMQLITLINDNKNNEIVSIVKYFDNYNHKKEKQ